MLFALIAIMALVGYEFGYEPILMGLVVMGGIVLNGLISIEAANNIKQGLNLAHKQTVIIVLAAVFNYLAWAQGDLLLVMGAGFGVPFAINIFILIENKIRGK